MVKEKDRTLEELRARLALVEQANADADQAVAGAVGASAYGSAGETAADGSLGGLSVGVSEGAVGAELRRQLKKSAFDMSLLEQRYTHLETRFNTLRDNHERVRRRVLVAFSASRRSLHVSPRVSPRRAAFREHVCFAPHRDTPVLAPTDPPSASYAFFCNVPC